MTNKIIQTNKGLKSNIHELIILTSAFNPAIIYLQESLLKEKDFLNIKYFVSYNFHQTSWQSLRRPINTHQQYHNEIVK